VTLGSLLTFCWVDSVTLYPGKYRIEWLNIRQDLGWILRGRGIVCLQLLVAVRSGMTSGFMMNLCVWGSSLTTVLGGIMKSTTFEVL